MNLGTTLARAKIGRALAGLQPLPLGHVTVVQLGTQVPLAQYGPDCRPPQAGIGLALSIVADLPSRTAARVAILTLAVPTGGARRAVIPGAGIVALALLVTQLTGRAGFQCAGPQ